MLNSKTLIKYLLLKKYQVSMFPAVESLLKLEPETVTGYKIL